MRFTFRVVLLALVVGVISWGQEASAQTNPVSGDTMTVNWQDASGNFIQDALFNAVTGDTLSDGTRADANRVYLLLRGGYYWDTQTISNNGYTLRIVGQTPGNTLQAAPPVVQLVTNNGQINGTHILQPYGNIYVKNVYFIGSDQNGVQGNYYQPIEVEGNNLTCVFDSCIFERTSFALPAWNGKNNEITFTNCKFRNLIGRPSTQQWEGRGISIWTDEDSVIVENCTFFNIGMTALQIEGGAANYVRFNHNTIVNLGRNINTGSWYKEAYFTNCLLVNTFWHGEGYTDYSLALNPSRDPRAFTSGMIGIGAIPSSYGPEQGVRIAIANMAAYLDPYFTSHYADTVRTQPYTNAVTDSFFNTYSPANGGQMVIKDTTWMNNYPNFTANPDNQTQIQNMYENITNLRAGVIPAQPYFYDLPMNGADTAWTSPSWPLPENFTYTDASLMTASTDGLPLGDLNWFPADLATWQQNKAAYIQQIENLPGKKETFTVDTTLEAEAGTAGGTATTKTVGGFVYYEFQTAGDIFWTFNVPNAGAVDSIVVQYNLNNQGQRGEFVSLNGTNLQNNSGYGEYHFDNTNVGVASGWYPVQITAAGLVSGATAFQNAPAGQNTLEIKKSWGYDFFGNVTVYVHGNSPIVLTIPEAVLTGGIPHITGSPWSPSGFKYDSLGTGGTISWTVPLASGEYSVEVFYQNVWGNSTAQISVDNGAAMSVSLPSNTDSTEANNMSSQFSVAAGSHTIALSGSGANVDYIQLISVLTGVKTTLAVPNTFVLAQNFPNPFNPTTQIEYSIPTRSLVTLAIYNVLGQKVATLVSGVQSVGQHEVTFDASRFASGVYFYRLNAAGYSVTKKMMLIK